MFHFDPHFMVNTHYFKLFISFICGIMNDTYDFIKYSHY